MATVVLEILLLFGKFPECELHSGYLLRAYPVVSIGGFP